MRISDEALDEFYGSYDGRYTSGVKGVCCICGEDVFADEEHFRSPVWDGERLICGDCVHFGTALSDLFEEMDVAGKLECLGMARVYADDGEGA